MSDTPIPTIAEQEEAYFEYLRLKNLSDQTRSLDDARAAGHAWLVYLDLFMPDEKKLARADLKPSNVATFPVHRTRPSARTNGRSPA